MATPIKNLITGLFCAVLNFHVAKAQLPEKISSGKLSNVAENFLQTAGNERALMLEKTQRQLKKISISEEKLRMLLDSSGKMNSEKLVRELQGKMDEIESFILNPDSMFRTLPAGPYVARIDSLSTLFSFAQMHGDLSPVLSDVNVMLSQLKQQLYYSGQIEKWLGERQQRWAEMLTGNGNFFPHNIKALFGEWQTEVNVCKQQIEQWKDALNDSRKMEQEVLSLLNRLPSFREFLGRNSELARLFGPPAGMSAAGAANPDPGLQNIQSIMQDLQARFGNSAARGGGFLQQQIQNGMDQLGQNQAGSVEGILPGVQLPLQQSTVMAPDGLSEAQKEKADLKARPVGKRLEIGWNLQTAIRLQDFPAIRDAGLSVGYKFNSRSVIGIGIAYKFGLGESLKEIKWSHEGAGFRSFLDWRMTQAGGKLFKGLWLTGGFEMNYWSRIAANAQWKELAWRPAGIAGLTKTIHGKKHNAKLQIIYNYLELNLPLEDRISIRWGKTF